MRKIIVYFTIICFLGTCSGIPALANVDFSDSEFVDFQSHLAFSIDKGPSNPFMIQEDFFRLGQELTESMAMELMLSLTSEEYSQGS